MAEARGFRNSSSCGIESKLKAIKLTARKIEKERERERERERVTVDMLPCLLHLLFSCCLIACRLSSRKMPAAHFRLLNKMHCTDASVLVSFLSIQTSFNVRDSYRRIYWIPCWVPTSVSNHSTRVLQTRTADCEFSQKYWSGHKATRKTHKCPRTDGITSGEMTKPDKTYWHRRCKRSATRRGMREKHRRNRRNQK